MLTLILIMLVVGIALIAFLAALTLFVQGYLYTEITPGVLWRAPAAGGILFAFLFLWCWMNYASEGSTVNIPYDTLFRFSPVVDMFPEPAKKIWTKKKGEKELIEYKLSKRVGGAGQVTYEYKEVIPPYRNWSPVRVEAVFLKHDGEKIRFEPKEAPEGAYRRFVSEDGWAMVEYEGLNGIPSIFHSGLLIVNLLFNFVHLALWFVVLWLILQFQGYHALGLAFVIWLTMTLLILPILFTQAVAL